MSEKEITTKNNNPEYHQLLLSVGETLEQGRRRAVAAVNTAMVQILLGNRQTDRGV